MSGMQFQANSFAVPYKDARKTIHSGTGVVGDDYDHRRISITSLSSFALKLTNVAQTEQRPRSWSSMRRLRRGCIRRSCGGRRAATRFSLLLKSKLTLCAWTDAPKILIPTEGTLRQCGTVRHDGSKDQGRCVLDLGLLESTQRDVN